MKITVKNNSVLISAGREYQNMSIGLFFASLIIGYIPGKRFFSNAPIDYSIDASFPMYIVALIMVASIIIAGITSEWHITASGEVISKHRLWWVPISSKRFILGEKPWFRIDSLPRPRTLTEYLHLIQAQDRGGANVCVGVFSDKTEAVLHLSKLNASLLQIEKLSCKESY